MNSSTEIATMSKRLTAIVGSDPEVSPSDGEKTLGMPDLVADMHSMISEQQKRIAEEGTATQRLDSLLQMMGQERERMAGQQGLVEQVMGVLDRQRSDNEMLLRALATGELGSLYCSNAKLTSRPHGGDKGRATPFRRSDATSNNDEHLQ